MFLLEQGAPSLYLTSIGAECKVSVLQWVVPKLAAVSSQS